jgi:tetraacyldisaccharide 4'-kinase
MERRLSELWYREDPGPGPLQPLAWLYGALVRARRGAFAAGWARSTEVGVPVVVVGNLTVGGTGKTPFTIWLAVQLRARGFTVGIVSRGYGRSGAGAVRDVVAQSDWRQVGDEPLLLARRTGCDTVVAAERVAGARRLVARGAQVILADDGLQHLRLARACEVLLIDGARGFGNGRLLPAGPLRERPTRPLRADVVVVNGAATHASLARWLRPGEALTMGLAVHEARSLAGEQPPQPLRSWQGRRVHAVAGIGNPARFFRELREQGIDVIEHPFADHHAFRASELDFADDLPVLMTEKDAVKCAGFVSTRLWYVPVSAYFSDCDAQALLARVLAKIGGAPPGGHS